MTKIEKIAIIGAGVMGAAYAAMFSDASAFSVLFVTRVERYKRLKEGSLTMNRKTVRCSGHLTGPGIEI